MSTQSFRQIIGVPGSTASPSDSTLVIIDAQNEYAEGQLKVTNAPETRKAIAGLLKKYRDADGKVVHVKHVVPEGAPVFTPNTKLAEEYEELAPKQGEKIIHKNYPSSFAETNLDDHLKEIGAKKTVLTGYMVSSPCAITDDGSDERTHADSLILPGTRLRIDDRQRRCALGI